MSLVAEPNINSPANVDAAKMWRDKRDEFVKVTKTDKNLKNLLTTPVTKTVTNLKSLLTTPVTKSVLTPVKRPLKSYYKSQVKRCHRVMLSLCINWTHWVLNENKKLQFGEDSCSWESIFLFNLLSWREVKLVATK